MLYRWDAPLFFANADTFRERIVTAVDDAEGGILWVVVAAEPTPTRPPPRCPEPAAGEPLRSR
ncbi:MAG: hypothetical protein IPQ09_02150 [Myxococcales bacterium]|nr:hypothetical protein [Myxococcales bacterium]